MLAVFFLLPDLRVDAAASKPEIGKESGMAVSTHWIADAVGQQILDNGGNAIDAAAAVGYALAVVHPTAGNIGGGGFAVIHLADGRNLTLDFREMAPATASREMYVDETGKAPRQYKDKDGKDLGPESLWGYKAAGVPGSVAGFNEMVAKYGKKSLAEIIDPAIKLAENGFSLTAGGASSLNSNAENFKHFEGSAKYFTKPDGSEYKTGELFVQKDLAETLKRIAKEGSDGFYKGKTAELIVADMPKYGGIITLTDLANYKAKWREPVKGTYNGYEILSMGPPSSGGTHIVQILNTMENTKIGEMGFGTAATVHLMAEAMRYAYADRSEYMGDPDYVNVPVAQLTAKPYAKGIYDQIVAYGDKARPSTEIKPGLGALREGENTTHYSVVDKEGNAVSVTYTINTGYGSKAAVQGAGFFMNNEMDDFMTVPGVPNAYGLIQGEANAIEPGKRPLSSMSPTIVLKDDKPYVVVGSPGGSTIITTVLQVISNIVDHGMNISEATAAPRIHMQWMPDRVTYEKFGLAKDVLAVLKTMGYDMVEISAQGDVDAIMVSDGAFHGAHDPRTYDMPPAIEPNFGPGNNNNSSSGGGSSGCNAASLGFLAIVIAAGGAVVWKKR
jgi:gamma-glutamyltranspeptidase/glutathione hydrolase